MLLIVAGVGTASAAGVSLRSLWDENLLRVELEDVSIKPNAMIMAWREIGSKYLLRSNFYQDVAATADSTLFSFQRGHATGKENGSFRVVGRGDLLITLLR